MCDAVLENETFHTVLFENPVPVFRNILVSFGQELVNRLPRSNVSEWLSQSAGQFVYLCHFSLADLRHVLFIAAAVTLLRYLLNFVILKRIPAWVGMTKENEKKFPESCFNSAMYITTWLLELYIMTNHPTNLFSDLSSHWKGWVRGGPVMPELYWLYMLQLGIYAHFLFATIFVNTKRKDFMVLVLHHALTIILIAWAYAIRLQYLGLVLLFLHDFGDLLLEFAKTVKYFEELNGKHIKAADTVANVLFGIFTLQWVLCRLYWYPMKILQSSMVVSVRVCINLAFYIPFNIMLMVLYLMQVYWFYYILKLLIKVVVNKESANDNREYDVIQQEKQKEAKKAQ